MFLCCYDNGNSRLHRTDFKIKNGYVHINLYNLYNWKKLKICYNNKVFFNVDIPQNNTSFGEVLIGKHDAM